MKTIFNTMGNIIGLVVIVGIGIILVLTLKRTNPQNGQVPTFQSPIEKAAPAPTDTPMLTQFSSSIKPPPTPYIPPLCTFDAKVPVTKPVSVSLLDKYVFSEPKVIYSYPGAIEISQWLPDNQRILFSQRDTKTGVETIYTFNINTGELTLYGKGRLPSTMPPSRKFVWVPVSQSVVYTTLEADKYILHISNGKTSEVIATDLASLYLSALPNGKDVSYVTRKNLAQVQVYDTQAKSVRTVSIDSKIGAIPAPTGFVDFWQQYQTAWSPNGKQYVYFNNQTFYLVDAVTGEECAIDLGVARDNGKRWALFAKWSPNGRYLALRVVAGEPIFPFVNLLIFDTITGKIKEIEFKSNKIVYGIAWSPDNRNLLAITSSDESIYKHKLFLVDTVTTKTREIKINIPLIETGYWGVDWNNGGQYITFGCPTLMETEPTINTGQLCITSVEIK